MRIKQSIFIVIVIISFNIYIYIVVRYLSVCKFYGSHKVAVGRLIIDITCVNI